MTNFTIDYAAATVLDNGKGVIVTKYVTADTDSPKRQALRKALLDMSFNVAAYEHHDTAWKGNLCVQVFYKNPKRLFGFFDHKKESAMWGKLDLRKDLTKQVKAFILQLTIGE